MMMFQEHGGIPRRPLVEALEDRRQLKRIVPRQVGVLTAAGHRSQLGRPSRSTLWTLVASCLRNLVLSSLREPVAKLPLERQLVFK